MHKKRGGLAPSHLLGDDFSDGVRDERHSDDRAQNPLVARDEHSTVGGECGEDNGDEGRKHDDLRGLGK